MGQIWDAVKKVKEKPGLAFKGAIYLKNQVFANKKYFEEKVGQVKDDLLIQIEYFQAEEKNGFGKVSSMARRIGGKKSKIRPSSKNKSDVAELLKDMKQTSKKKLIDEILTDYRSKQDIRSIGRKPPTTKKIIKKYLNDPEVLESLMEKSKIAIKNTNNKKKQTEKKELNERISHFRGLESSVQKDTLDDLNKKKASADLDPVQDKLLSEYTAVYESAKTNDSDISEDSSNTPTPEDANPNSSNELPANVNTDQSPESPNVPATQNHPTMDTNMVSFPGPKGKMLTMSAGVAEMYFQNEQAKRDSRTKNAAIKAGYMVETGDMKLTPPGSTVSEVTNENAVGEVNTTETHSRGEDKDKGQFSGILNSDESKWSLSKTKKLTASKTATRTTTVGQTM